MLKKEERKLQRLHNTDDLRLVSISSSSCCSPIKFSDNQTENDWNVRKLPFHRFKNKQRKRKKFFLNFPHFHATLLHATCYKILKFHSWQSTVLVLGRKQKIFERHFINFLNSHKNHIFLLTSFLCDSSVYSSWKHPQTIGKGKPGLFIRKEKKTVKEEKGEKRWPLE